MKKASSINLNQTIGCNICVFEKSVSNLSVKIHAQTGPNYMPIAIPEICWNTISQSLSSY